MPKESKPVGAALTCREHGKLRIGENGLTEGRAQQYLRLAKKAQPELKRDAPFPALSRTENGIQAGGVVGVLSIPGQTLEILPKIDGDDGAARAATIHMLAAALDIRIATGELAGLATQRSSLLDILVRLFADRLLAAVRRGLPRRYVGREEDLGLLRGRLDVKRQVTRLAARPDRVACRFDELSENTPLNRVLKAAVTRLAALALSNAGARSLAELAGRFEAVGDTRAPLREPVRLDRTNTAFHDLYRLARLFLEGDWQSATGGGAPGFALLFAMNVLFEQFIGRSLKRALAPGSVRLQPRGGHAINAENGEELFVLQPDAVVDLPGKTLVLDTKWKALSPDDPRSDVAPGDIYQMLAYRSGYGATGLILLYPWSRELGAEDGPLRCWTVAGTNCPLIVATIDVGRPERVRAALRKIAAPDAQASTPDGNAPPSPLARRLPDAARDHSSARPGSMTSIHSL